MGILRTVGDLIWAGLGTLLVLAVIVTVLRVVRSRVPATSGVINKAGNVTGVGI